MEKKTAWQYKAICKINRVIFYITSAIEDFCDNLESKACRRWGGYKVVDYVDSTNTHWCKVISDERVEPGRIIVTNFDKDGNQVAPGDVVFFDWNDS